MALLATTPLAIPAAGEVEVPSGSSVRVEWDPATGNVAAYFVYVIDEAGRVSPYATRPANDPWTMLTGSEGSAYAVRVAGVSPDGEFGPLSDPSEFVRFAAAAEEPPVEPPPVEPPPVEPPPVEPPPVEPPPVEPPPVEPPPVEPPPVEPPPVEPPPVEPPPVEPPVGADYAPPPVNARAVSDPLDFDADGSTELLLRDVSSGDLAAWYLAGATPMVQVLGVAPLSPTERVVGNADYDGNGYADLVVQDDASGEVRIHFLANAAEVGKLTFTGVGSDVVGSGDFDGDGAADLVLEDAGSGDVEVWPSLYMAGNEDVLPLATLASGGTMVGVGDLDGDGAPDVLVNEANYFRGYAVEAVELGRRRNISRSAGHVVAGLCDRNADGKLDLLLGDDGMWEYRDYAIRVGGLRAAAAGLAGMDVVDSRHYTGLEQCEIAARNPSTGDISLLLLDGTSPVAVHVIAPGAGWEPVGVGYLRP